MDGKATTDHGRRALVTGGAQGIGWAICRSLAARGYRIALADIDAKAADGRAAELGAGHVALAVDLTDWAAAAALPRQAALALGGLEVVVNNAGMTDTTGQPLTRLPEASFDRLVALNLVAVEAICTEAAGILGPGSNVVNLASGASYRPLALRGPYSATKAGIVALTEALARELGPRGICVSAVAPGYTRTPLVEALAREGRVDLDKVAASIPMGRLATPEDIASVAAFLAGRDGHPLSGQTVVVDGGGLAGPAPLAVSPEAGAGAAGSIITVGAPRGCDIGTGIGAEDVSDFSRAASGRPISAVVDLAALGSRSDTASALDRLWKTAKSCAGLPNRASEFSLLVVCCESDGSGDAAAVAAQGMLARTLALEWAPSRMRVNALIWRGETWQGLGAVCRFLVGPDAGFVTGQVIHAGAGT